jgi:sulfopyruvate decarboxylase subunit beta
MPSNDDLSPVDHVLDAVKGSEVDVILHLPCGKIAPLLDVLCKNFYNVPLTREEEGVGIAAGVDLAGKRPLMVIQNSGLGNMVNALMSLTKYYELPLPIFVSHRGVYEEEIAAQIPLGEHLEDILEAMEIEYISYNEPEEVRDISQHLSDTFSQGKIKCFLFSPRVWEGLSRDPQIPPLRTSCEMNVIKEEIGNPIKRYEALERVSWFLKDKAVISNMGFPSRELYSLFDQSSNFYMLGSLGLASSIGLGVSLFTEKDVVVIDGDGSLLMNPNALISIGNIHPRNLTILCLDNGTYASTGDQVTSSGCGFAMEDLAKASGIGNILVTDDPVSIMKLEGEGPKFVKLAVQPGNADVGTIDLSSIEIKKRFQRWLLE